MNDPRATAPTVASSLSTGSTRLEDLVGQTVGGRYRIVRRLASGGMGSVFVGEQLNLHRSVAIKVVTGTEADLLIQRRSCGPARELWRTHQTCNALAARKRGKPARPAPFPPCR